MGFWSKFARVFADVCTLGLAEIGFQTADAASAAGGALGLIATTIQKVGEETNKLLEEIQKQLVIVRYTPRDESELWDEEKERLNGLRQKLSQLKAELNAISSTVPPFGDYSKFFKYLGKLMEIVKIQAAIDSILYREPGVVPQLLENTAETMERFNEIEQPKIEDILDSVDDNLEESQEILEQIKKLFVVKKLVPKPDIEILPLEREFIKFHGTMVKGMASEIQSRMTIASGYSVLKGSLLPIDYKVTSVFDVKKTGSGGEQTDGGSPDTGLPSGFASGTVVPAASRASLVAAYGVKKSSVFAKVESLELARISLAQREITKANKAIEGLKYRTVEEPGVIPLTLEEIRKTIQRVNSIEQPKVEQILDSIDGNLRQSQGILSKTDALLGGILTFVTSNAILIKIALVVFIGFSLLILLLTPLLMIRIILFGL